MWWLPLVVWSQLAPEVPDELPADGPQLTAQPPSPPTAPTAAEGDDPTDPLPADHPNPHWLFVQAQASALGLLSGQSHTTFGFSGYLGGAYGVPLPHPAEQQVLRGLFVGAGLFGFTGSTDLAQCPGIKRCAGRQAIGGALRFGVASWNRQNQAVPAVIWPDTFVYVQLGAFAGRELVPSAPLAPGVATGLYGGRVDLGITSVGLSRAILWQVGEITDNITLTSVWALLLVPLVLINHFELNLEWSGQAYSPGGPRFGLSLGSGF